MTILELKAKWDTISPYPGGFLLISGEHPLSFHVGYTGKAQRCFMVLNCGEISKLPSSKAVEVDCVSLGDGSKALRFLLNYDSLEDIFIKLCWDLIDSSYAAPNPVQKIVEQYKSWFRLLQQSSKSLMSSELIKGTIGELLYLEEIIDVIGPADAVNSWTGPEGSDQDFNFTEGWAEIKAVKISADRVKLTSLQQLDRPDQGKLIVYFMDKTSSGGSMTISLPEQIDIVKNKLSNPRLEDVLLCKLAKNGYFEGDAENYKEIRYRLAEVRKYNVPVEFPRLTRNNVPVEVLECDYYLGFAMIDTYKIQE